jgi:hypothetical protein
MSIQPTQVWPTLVFEDAHGALAFLADAFGFEERALYARDGTPEVIEDAEMAWPGGGGIMLGSAGKDGSPFGRRTSGGVLRLRRLRRPGRPVAPGRGAGAGWSCGLGTRTTARGSASATRRQPLSRTCRAVTAGWAGAPSHRTMRPGRRRARTPRHAGNPQGRATVRRPAGPGRHHPPSAYVRLLVLAAILGAPISAAAHFTSPWWAPRAGVRPAGPLPASEPQWWLPCP